MVATASMDTTSLLVAWSDGDEQALGELMPRVYGELRQLASWSLRGERGRHACQATELVHDAFLRLIDQRNVCWKNRAHFFGIAAEMMRRILVDHARQFLYQKRGNGARPVSLDDTLLVSSERAPEIVALDEALSDLHREHPEIARIVELRYFGGMTSEEIGHLLGISIPTVTRRWSFARAWLFRRLQPDTPAS